MRRISRQQQTLWRARRIAFHVQIASRDDNESPRTCRPKTGAHLRAGVNLSFQNPDPAILLIGMLDNDPAITPRCWPKTGKQNHFSFEIDGDLTQRNLCKCTRVTNNQPDRLRQAGIRPGCPPENSQFFGIGRQGGRTGSIDLAADNGRRTNQHCNRVVPSRAAVRDRRHRV